MEFSRSSRAKYPQGSNKTSSLSVYLLSLRIWRPSSSQICQALQQTLCEIINFMENIWEARAYCWVCPIQAWKMCRKACQRRGCQGMLDNVRSSFWYEDRTFPTSERKSRGHNAANKTATRNYEICRLWNGLWRLDDIEWFLIWCSPDRLKEDCASYISISRRYVVRSNILQSLY